MTELSVVICTHNPRHDYLRRTLESLQAQTLPRDRWELIIVDNASTAPVAGGLGLSWHPQARCVVEPKLGLTFARQRGIQEAKGRWIVFVDDDNVLQSDYLALVLEIAARRPDCAVFGAGMIVPEFEQPPSPEVVEHLPKLALRSVAAPQSSDQPADNPHVPYGAGLCVRDDIGRRFIQLKSEIQDYLPGPKGGELFRHDDELFSWIGAAERCKFGIFPELKVTHLIAAGRVTHEYILKLLYYSAISHWIFYYLLENRVPKTFGLKKRLWLMQHAVRHGMFSVRSNLAEMKGEDRAARMIAEQQLAPLKLSLKA